MLQGWCSKVGEEWWTHVNIWYLHKEEVQEINTTEKVYDTKITEQQD